MSSSSTRNDLLVIIDIFTGGYSANVIGFKNPQIAEDIMQKNLTWSGFFDSDI